MQRSAAVRAIQVTCPHCGARLNVGDGDVVTCEYCGTASRVQRRTRVLDRVKPPPPEVNRPLQIAVQHRSRAPGIVIGLLVLLPIIITIVVVAIVVSTTQKTVDQVTKGGGAASTYVPPEKRPPMWQGTKSVLGTDVNGDGRLDIVGRGRQVNAGDIVMVLALDGNSGATLWQSDVLGTYTDTYRGPLAVSNDLVVFASERGEVHAIETKTGRRMWKVALPERVKHVCAAAPDEVLLLGADNVLRSLARADGKERTPSVKTCTKLPADGDELEHGRVDHKLQKKLGLYADRIVDAGDLRVLGAARATGTRVTQLAAVDKDGNEKWRITASKDPLGAEGTPRYLAAGAHEVCAIYHESSNNRLACFKLADGTRLWEGELPSFVSGLVVLGGSLLVSSNRGLEVRDISTGAVRWKTRE